MFFGEFPEPTDTINRYIWSQQNNQRERERISNIAYFRPAISAVARETKKTKAGLILFPPAPKICSAADIKTGFSDPTI